MPILLCRVWVRRALKIVAADSGAAILDSNYHPLSVVASAAVLVDTPYRRPTRCIAEPLFSNVENGHLLIIHELELCQKLLKEEKADSVHLDMSLGSLSLEELSAVELSKMKISSRARQHILQILPKIRRFSTDIKRVYGIDVLAIGKESMPVRIAELHCGAYATLYCAKKAIVEKKELKMGLPAKCTAVVERNSVTLKSLAPGEHDLITVAKDEENILEKVEIQETPNPVIRGFRVLEIKPKV
jgi:hypothetical protein